MLLKKSLFHRFSICVAIACCCTRLKNECYERGKDLRLSYNIKLILNFYTFILEFCRKFFPKRPAPLKSMLPDEPAYRGLRVSGLGQRDARRVVYRYTYLAYTCVILCATFTRACRAERVDWLPGRSIAPPRLRPWVNACDRHPIAMPPRKPLYILVGMFYNPSRKTLLDRDAKSRRRARERAKVRMRARANSSLSRANWIRRI